MRPFELIRRLLNNWPIKLAALLTALVLWYQLREVEPVVERSLERPLEVVGVDAERRAVGLPEKVLVRLRGTSRIIKNLNPNAVVAYIDLSGVKQGQFDEPVRVRAPSGVTVVEVVPAEVAATLERLGAAVLPVEVYSPGNAISYRPDSVEIKGAQSLVERARLAVGVNVGDKGVARLVAVDAEGLPIAGLELNPDQAKITVIGPLLTQKQVKLVLTPPPAGLTPVSVKAPGRVTVVGPPEALAGLVVVKGTVDWRAGEYDAPLKLHLPPKVGAIGLVLVHLKVEPAKPIE